MPSIEVEQIIEQLQRLRTAPLQRRLKLLQRNYLELTSHGQLERLEQTFTTELAFLRTNHDKLLAERDLQKFTVPVFKEMLVRFGFRDRAIYENITVFARSKNDAEHIARKVLHQPIQEATTSEYVQVFESWVLMEYAHPEGCFTNPNAENFICFNVLQDKLLTLRGLLQ